MASPPSPTDQTGLLKEVLEAVKALTLNQTLLSSHVDAISGRVNVLAGMKEVRDVAETAPSSTPASSSSTTAAPVDPDSDDVVVPQSPSLPAAQLEGVAAGPSSPSSALSHARKPSVTSRIILT